MKKIILFFAIALLAIPFSYAQELGCCANPNAGAFTCNSERPVRKTPECCPTPESSNPSYYNSPSNPFGPSTFSECASSYFFPSQDCSSQQILACAQGCCCGEFGGTRTSMAKCIGANVRFNASDLLCASCPSSQCSDGVDNDNNGCNDFINDTGCSSRLDNSESGGTCADEAPACVNPSYSPKLSNLQIIPFKGQKKLQITWNDECRAQAAYYQIYRCTGACASMELINTASSNSYSDDSSELLFNRTYSYKIVAIYSFTALQPFINGTGRLGSEKCQDKLTTAKFCSNNSAYYCDSYNNLVAEGSRCQSSQVCVIDSSGKPTCAKKDSCNYASSNPLGLFYSVQGCETGTYCFYDRSPAIVNSCFSCEESMSCYDYKTRTSCERNNCKVGNCQWTNTFEQFGIGVCADADSYNCQWCGKKGTPQMGNSKAYNELLDVCTRIKSDALSNPRHLCYYKNSTSKNCNDAICTDYDAAECSAQISIGSKNTLASQSNDQCSIKVCQKSSNSCIKNSDGDNSQDCEDSSCESDYFAPNTSMQVVLSRGIPSQLIISITDKLSTNSSYLLRTGEDYKTFFCVEPCAKDRHPFDKSIQSRRIAVIGLKLWDYDNSSPISNLNEGQNTISFYSQDPAKNLEVIKSITIAATANSSGPRIRRVNASDGKILNGAIYTPYSRPSIKIDFFEPALITHLRFISQQTGAGVNLQLPLEMLVSHSFSLPASFSDGIYYLEVNAKNSRGIFMGAPERFTIIIDTKKPSIAIAPSNNSVLSQSQVQFSIISNEPVTLKSAALNSLQIKSNFSTIDNSIFDASINLSDGTRQFLASVSDYAGNDASNSSLFEVDSNPTEVKMNRPERGVSSQYVFDIEIETDSKSECRWEFDETSLDFQFMEIFSNSDKKRHIIEDFNMISQGDRQEHTLSIKCKDEKNDTFGKNFKISVDPSSPIIRNYFAYPNPVVESPAKTTLNIETDDNSICKYSRTKENFNEMEFKFAGYDSEIFSTVNKQNITLPGEGNFTFYAACMNKAGLLSNTSRIGIGVTFSNLVTVISRTQNFFTTTLIALIVETNKLSQCKYSEIPSALDSGNLISAQAAYIHRKDITTTNGNHTFYVKCRDSYLSQWSGVLQIKFIVDSNPPLMLYVNDSTVENNPEISCINDQLRVRFLGSDSESGIKNYSYSLLKSTPSSVIVNYTGTLANELWVEGLALQQNSKYLFNVKSRDWAGYESSPLGSDGVTVNSTFCDPPSCGNGIVNPGESCDSANFGTIGNNCTKHLSTYTGGNVSCTGSCQLNTTKCEGLGPGPCGNSIINTGEDCDTNTYGTINECTDYAEFIGGNLSCINCRLNTTKCTQAPPCGNGRAESGEDCDKNDLNGRTCKSFSNLIGGTLKCTSSCSYDTSECTRQPNCPNGAIDSGEECDGSNFGIVKECSDISGFISGTISCNSKCQLDTTKCTPKPSCGNAIVNPGESCDGKNFGIQTNKCSDYKSSFTGGNLSCTSTCQLDTTKCDGLPGTCEDTAINIGEHCNANTYGAIDECIDYGSFSGGNLSCSLSTCKLDTTKCTPKPNCPNGAIDTGEKCDMPQLGLSSNQCTNYSADFGTGTIKCDSACNYDTSSCSKAKTCGNSRLDAEEQCDGELFYDRPNLDCSNYSKNFISGTIGCSNKCRVSTSLCSTNSTDIIKPICNKRGDCPIGTNCDSNLDCESRFCDNGKCALVSCSDGIKNQQESSIDCGGSCSKCGPGKLCNSNTDCATGNCNYGTCRDVDKCSDGQLTSGESDIDCGGPCLSRCAEGQHCDSDDNCVIGTRCQDLICRKTEEPNPEEPVILDTDGDGIPDEWETANDMDSNNASDAQLDSDDDGLTNYQEWEYQTNPNSNDTDGDGYTDKEEIDAGTNPLDAEDYPKSSITTTLLFILLIIALLCGFGYLGYRIIEKKKEENFSGPRQFSQLSFQPPRTTSIQPQKRIIPLQKKENFQVKQRDFEKEKERSSIFGSFDDVKQKLDTRQEILKTQSDAEIPKKQEEPQVEDKERQQKKPKPSKQTTKKSKEDVFVKLKEVAKIHTTKKRGKKKKT